jgi:hypothetical protein
MLQRGAALVVRAGMFDNLSQRLEKVWDTVRKDGKLTADNIKEPMREIRRALLEADVRLLLSTHAEVFIKNIRSFYMCVHVSPSADEHYHVWGVLLAWKSCMFQTACMHTVNEGTQQQRKLEHTSSKIRCAATHDFDTFFA